MLFPDDDLTKDLQALSATQLREAAAYVKELLRRGSVSKLDNAADEQIAIRASDASPDLFLSLNTADWTVVECDSSVTATLGTGLVGKPFLQLVDPDYVESVRHAFSAARRHREVKNVRVRLLRASGDSFPATLAARWVDKTERNSELIDVFCRDITFLKQLRNIEIFSEMLPIGIALVDEKGQITFANSPAEQIFGYEQGELAHQPTTLLFPDEPASFFNLDAVPDPRPQVEPGRELHGRKKDGSPIDLKIGWSSIRLGDHRFAVASIADFTVRKSIEDKLRKHEEQRSLIFSEGLLGDFTWNIERDEVEAHPTIFKLYGAAPIAGPVPGSWFRSRQHPDEAAETEAKWRSQLEAGSELAVEFRVIGDDGVTRWIDCRGIVIHDGQGRQATVHGINIDITARKQAERERRESDARARSAEERLHTAVQFSNAAVWRWHAEVDSVEWFGPVFELTGKHPAELNTFAAFLRITLPADIPSLEENVRRCYALGTDYSHEFRIVRADGQVRWLAGRGGTLRDPNGRIWGLTGVNFDITDRKTAEEELRQSERDFRQLTNALPQIVFTANTAGEIDYHNDRFYELSGLSRGQTSDVRWTELLSNEDRQSYLDSWFTCVASGQLYQRECRIWDRHLQQYRWYLVRALPVRNADGDTVRWIGTSTDIHDQKTAAARLEGEVQGRTRELNLSLSLLRHREEQLEKSLHEKDAMLREIHHRVKNNLQIVSSLLNMQAATAANLETVGPLRDSERRISSMAMIHEQLYGTDDMQTVEFAAHARWLSESILSSMTDTARVTCCLDLQPVNLTINQAIPCALILNELLTNAVKYAYPRDLGGPITIRLSAEAGLASLTVSDQGVGLPTTIDPFLPKTLGMEIVHVLVNQIDGQLLVAGPPGASFTIRFRPEDRPLGADNLSAYKPQLIR